MRLPVAAIALICALLAVVGCGSGDDAETPAACLGGTGAYLAALRAAPGEVLLGGSVPIEDCLTKGQSAGDLAEIGTTTLGVATRLNDSARRAPGGPAPVELGYLVGAFEQAAQGTAGIHADLVRRIETAARYAPSSGSLPREFRAAYDRGFAAAQQG